MTRRAELALALGFSVLGAAACGGGRGVDLTGPSTSGGASPTVDVAGTWTGTLSESSTSGPRAGSTVLVLVQSGDRITGSGEAHGSRCLPAAFQVQGTVFGNGVSLSLGHEDGTESAVSVEGTIDGRAFSGAYSSTRRGCDSEGGAFSLER
ncbi:MAG TPA: hypothetical protein VL691_22485 [Vicinamibacteria bacterium]|nr:hypothetical protein [Vicinamibacteria bacterium]